MKERIIDYLSYAFFLLVMGVACYLTCLLTETSFVYRILYEGL